MSTYTNTIAFGIFSFPLIAFIITLPYMIYQYRKFGSIPWLRTLIVYSFVFYLLVAYYMVILPLPADHSAIVPYAARPQLVPFNFVQEFLAETTFSFSDLSTWLNTLRDPYVYEAFFNMLLLVPLGMYLRYYFRRTWWQALLIGFSVTLFYEVSQITGLWGLYEHPYRLFDVDDLIMNTLGTMVGFWIVGPAMRVLPDIRVINEEAREAGMRASVTKRALSFGIDLVLATTISVLCIVVTTTLTGSEPSNPTSQEGGIEAWVVRLVLLAVFIAAPIATHGQTPGQKLLHLRVVRPNASDARWYQYLVRYGLLYLFIVVPLSFLLSILALDSSQAGELNMLAAFAREHQEGIIVVWFILMAAWVVSLILRAIRSALTKRPFVMLNGLLSNTRVMTKAGIALEQERRAVLDVSTIGALEHLIAEKGTPLSELMDRAGCAVANEVRAWVPDPAPVVVLTGAGNNGGDGWVVARELAQAGYPTTLVAPDLAENFHAEPARTTALEVFADASAHNLALRVLIAPDADILAKAIDQAEVLVDALMGTGFNGSEIRAPYAQWIQAANRRRFEGLRSKGRGRHRKREHERGEHTRTRKNAAPLKVKDAPFALSIDTPSGLSAQTGNAAKPCFTADMTVTMLAFKPGLVTSQATRWTGIIKLAKLVDTKPYLEQLRASEERDEMKNATKQ